MTMTKKSMDFHPNNIGFRVLSSKLMERFKQTQSFVLEEMEHGTYPFSRTSKEAVLLYTDVTFEWILALEARIIKDQYKVDLTEEKAKTLALSIESYFAYIHKVITSHPSLFEAKPMKVWMDSRYSIEDKLLLLAKDKKRRGTVSFFTESVNIIIDSIEEMRLDLFEIDYLHHGGMKPFLCVTDLDSDFRQEESRLINKATVYKKAYGAKTFSLKNYTNSTNFFRRFSKTLHSDLDIREDTEHDESN